MPSDVLTQDQTDDKGPSIVVDMDTGVDDGLAPGDADAIKQARDALEAANQQAAAARAATQQAQTENARLRDAALRERAGRATDRKAMLAQAVETADAEIKSALSAKRIAREAGDIEAENDADEVLASARYRKNHAAGELAQLGDAPTSEPTSDRTAPQQGGGQQQWTPSPRARQWMNEHPEFDEKGGYHAAAVEIHNRLAHAGITEASGEIYFNMLNAGLSAQFGENHGRKGAPMNETRPNGGDRGANAAPSNRGGANGSGAMKLLPLASGLGQVRVQYRQDGTIARASFVDQNTRENMEEGAKVCYPEQYQDEKTRKAAIDRYTVEQIKIAEQNARGENTGLIYGEGGTFR